MILIVDHAEGCVLPVRAQPGARRNSIVGEWNEALKVAVMAPPEDGRANQALVEVLCKAFDLRKSQVELIAGPTSRDKKFLLRGVKAAELTTKIPNGK